MNILSCSGYFIHVELGLFLPTLVYFCRFLGYHFQIKRTNHHAVMFFRKREIRITNIASSRNDHCATHANYNECCLNLISDRNVQNIATNNYVH